MNSSASNLRTLARYTISKPETQHSFTLTLSLGRIETFHYKSNPEKSAIVNAANEQCLGGGGVDGVISDAGGEELLEDRLALPIINAAVRCPTGQAKITGPNQYGSLYVPYVIHAVGPNYLKYPGPRLAKGDEELRSTYLDAMERAREEKLEAVAFSLISSGIYRGNKSKADVFRVAMKALCEVEPYDELKNVYICAFTHNDGYDLVRIASSMGLQRYSESIRNIQVY